MKNKEGQIVEKNRRFVQLGRGLGEFPTNEQRTVFIVANGLKQEQLTPFEYVIWGQVSRFQTLAQWEAAIQQKIANVKNLNWPKVLQKLVDTPLIHPWSFSGIQDPGLLAIHATRQGYAHGFINEKWLISDTAARKSIALTKDQFDVWNAAAGKAMLLEVIDTLMEQREISVDEAFGLVVNNGFQLVQLSLWNLEYMDLSGLEGAE